MSINTENNIPIHPQVVSLKEDVQTDAKRGAAILTKPLAAIIALATTAFNSLELYAKALLSNLTNRTAVTPTEVNSVQEDINNQVQEDINSEVQEDINNQSFAQRTKNLIYSGVNYAKNNPIEIALGASAVLGAGYGAYAYATSAAQLEISDLNESKNTPGAFSESSSASKADSSDSMEQATQRNPGSSDLSQESCLGSCEKELFAPLRSGESPSSLEGVLQTFVKSQDIVNTSNPFTVARPNHFTNKPTSSLDFFENAALEAKEIGHLISESGVYQIYTIPNNFLRLSESLVNNYAIKPAYKNIYHESWVEKNVVSPIIEKVLTPVSELPVVSPVWNTTKKIAEFCKEQPLAVLLVAVGFFITYKTVTAQESGVLPPDLVQQDAGVGLPPALPPPLLPRAGVEQPSQPPPLPPQARVALPPPLLPQARVGLPSLPPQAGVALPLPPQARVALPPPLLPQARVGLPPLPPQARVALPPPLLPQAGVGLPPPLPPRAGILPPDLVQREAGVGQPPLPPPLPPQQRLGAQSTLAPDAGQPSAPPSSFLDQLHEGQRQLKGVEEKREKSEQKVTVNLLLQSRSQLKSIQSENSGSAEDRIEAIAQENSRRNMEEREAAKAAKDPLYQAILKRKGALDGTATPDVDTDDEEWK